MAVDLAGKMGFQESNYQEAADQFKKLYELFVKTDSTLVEINPMAEDREGKGDALVS